MLLSSLTTVAPPQWSAGLHGNCTTKDVFLPYTQKNQQDQMAVNNRKEKRGGRRERETGGASWMRIRWATWRKLGLSHRQWAQTHTHRHTFDLWHTDKPDKRGEKAGRHSGKALRHSVGSKINAIDTPPAIQTSITSARSVSGPEWDGDYNIMFNLQSWAPAVQPFCMIVNGCHF